MPMPEERARESPHFTTLQELYQERKVFVDLPQDIYGVAIAAAIGDLSVIMHGQNVKKVNFARLIFGIVTLAVNLWLQLFILYYVNHYIVQNAVHDAQENYAQFHREVFSEDGEFVQEKWDNWNNGPYMELCNMAVSKLSFSAGIVFLWCARMLNEVRDSWQLAHDMFSIENLPAEAKPHEMLYEVLDDSGETLRVEIVAVSWQARFIVSILVLLPKIVVATLLTYIGCRWLAATQSFGDLILNALALEFVIGIDDLMHEAFTPLDVRQFIELTKFAHIPKDKSALDGQTDETSAEVIRSMLLVVGLLVWAFVYLNYFQQEWCGVMVWCYGVVMVAVAVVVEDAAHMCRSICGEGEDQFFRIEGWLKLEVLKIEARVLRPSWLFVHVCANLLLISTIGVEEVSETTLKYGTSLRYGTAQFSARHS
ncbi:unnamed protein product [Durusdinium trenchii]|uniref:Transmembrane protein n=1 Tax=Durusdinium trenchii TaxID=1381693 RepID=A0ABP0HNI9_9DINO